MINAQIQKIFINSAIGGVARVLKLVINLTYVHLSQANDSLIFVHNTQQITRLYKESLAAALKPNNSNKDLCTILCKTSNACKCSCEWLSHCDDPLTVAIQEERTRQRRRRACSGLAHITEHVLKHVNELSGISGFRAPLCKLCVLSVYKVNAE